jgi:hypothetical protein
MLYELPNKVIVNLEMVTTISVEDTNLLYFHFEKRSFRKISMSKFGWGK